MNLKPGTKLVFIGYSVTDCGRLRPEGGGSRGALGQGYVAEVDDLLRTVYPKRPVRVTNMGVSGDTVKDLARRWDSDVIALEPDWLAVFIGINDVWRQFGVGPRSDAVMPDDFELIYEMLIRRTLPQLKGLVLMTPYYVQDDRADPMRRRMDAYGLIVKELARRHEVVLVDTQAAVDRMLRRTEYKVIAPDRVHPTEDGHRLLAYTFVRALGIIPRSLRSA